MPPKSVPKSLTTCSYRSGSMEAEWRRFWPYWGRLKTCDCGACNDGVLGRPARSRNGAHGFQRRLALPLAAAAWGNMSRALPCRPRRSLAFMNSRLPGQGKIIGSSISAIPLRS